MRISDWSSDVCSSDLQSRLGAADAGARALDARTPRGSSAVVRRRGAHRADALARSGQTAGAAAGLARGRPREAGRSSRRVRGGAAKLARSEEQPSELQSLMSNSTALFCLIKKNDTTHQTT